MFGPWCKHGAERGLSNRVAAEMMMTRKVKDRWCQRYHVGLVSPPLPSSRLRHVQRDVTLFHPAPPNRTEHVRTRGPNTTEPDRSYTTDCPTLTPLYRYVQSDNQHLSLLIAFLCSYDRGGLDLYIETMINHML